MTKEELITLASQGKARVEVAENITRYSITPEGVNEQGEQIEYPVIVLCIDNLDRREFIDTAYFHDGLDESELTDDEEAMLRSAIAATLPPPAE